MTDPAPRARAPRSKAVAAWLALLLGPLGAHRVYLHGFGDRVAFVPWLPTALGLVGVVRMRTLGQDDRVSWLLIPLLGLVISAAMLQAIVIALTPDAKWDARHNGGRASRPGGWPAVLAAIAALMIGGAVLMGTIAFAGQKFFEWQFDAGAAPR